MSAELVLYAGVKFFAPVRDRDMDFLQSLLLALSTDWSTCISPACLSLTISKAPV